MTALHHDITLDPDSFDDLDVREDEQLDLRDRQALRRVAGLSTELVDVSEVEYRALRLERVVLIGVWTSGSVVDAEISLVELAALAETAGSQVFEGSIQRRPRPDPATYTAPARPVSCDIVVSSGADSSDL